MALGAQRRDVLNMIVSQGMRPVIIGTVAGILTSFGAARVLANLLYGVTTTDAVSYVSAGLLLIAVAAVATYIPARRAASTDPITVLRYE